MYFYLFNTATTTLCTILSGCNVCGCVDAMFASVTLHSLLHHRLDLHQYIDTKSNIFIYCLLFIFLLLATAIAYPTTRANQQCDNNERTNDNARDGSGAEGTASFTTVATLARTWNWVFWWWVMGIILRVMNCIEIFIV